MLKLALHEGQSKKVLLGLQILLSFVSKDVVPAIKLLDHLSCLSKISGLC